MTKHKQTRREKFLLEMEAVVAWGPLLSVIDPHYPKAVGTTAKTSDMSQFANLLHGDETRVSADRGYVYAYTPHLEDGLIEDWVGRKSQPGKPLDAWTRNLNGAIASLRAIGERPFRTLKRQFGYTKMRYRGLLKNTAQLVTLFALGESVSGEKRAVNLGINPSAAREAPGKVERPGEKPGNR